MPDTDLTQATYPLRTTCRVTGLSAELLRAWERRHRIVVPMRTPGGTRRYSKDDLEKLRLVKAAVDAGHRIGRVAEMNDEELRNAAQPSFVLPRNEAHLGEILSALDRLDALESQRLLGFQLSALGAVRFSRQIAKPLVHEIGERWSQGTISIAAEHMATAILRTMFGAALQPTVATAFGPRIVFATPSGEHHELGLQMAALTAMGAGAQPIYLGADLPADELARAVERTRAAGIGLSFVTIEPEMAEQFAEAVEAALPAPVPVWVGGRMPGEVALPSTFERIVSLEDFERRITLLGYDKALSHPS